LQVDEGLADVLREDRDDGHAGLEGHGREAGPLLLHDLVVGAAQLSLVAATWSQFWESVLCRN
jgi:hypothetical protein